MAKKYQKLDPISHIIKRPDMYVGSLRSKTSNEYILENGKIILKKISYPPALLRIFIEPLSNAIDNVEISKKEGTPCTRIKINMDIETGKITIWNDGAGIPIEFNNEGKYIHTMIFGELHTSSNYSDTEERIVSGKNGLGVKLVSVFSTYFNVKSCDPNNKKTFVQTWSNNMREATQPKINKTVLKRAYTEVSWIPDFSLFSIKKYTQDIFNLYKRYIYETSMLTKVNVFLNDEKICVKSLLDYAKLYNSSNDEHIYHKGNNFEVVVMPSSEYIVISFVNGIYTSKGGRHVDSWCETIFRPIVNKFNKSKDSKINIKDVKQFFKLFVSVIVDKPEFESQEKHELLYPDVSSSILLKHINTIYKWDNTQKISQIIQRKDLTVLEKSTIQKKHTPIKGLDKANKSGTKFSPDCTLILCEGLSAKTYAITGIDVGFNGKKGRDWYGIMSLMGKILNVRDKSPTVISKNKEVTAIINALGLKFGINYTIKENFETLNYGKVMLLSDSDSVSEDTPLLLKNTDDLMEIRTINDISTDWGTYGNKEISNTIFQVWTDKGWTKIEKVIRHKVTKKMFRILTHTGCVDVTEDHSLIRENQEKISPKDCKIGDSLLHSLPNHFPTKYFFNITIQEAYVMGIFWASGVCDINKKSWCIIIYNDKLDILIKAKNILKDIYPYKFKITEKKLYSKLFIPEGNRNRKHIVEKYSIFYGNNFSSRIVPLEILNSQRKIKEEFLKGICDGDCNTNSMIKTHEKISAHGIYLLCTSLGYNVSFDLTAETFKYPLANIIFNNNPQKDANVIKKIIPLDDKEQYVYDLQTSNHHFQAGIGRLIVHNTDGHHISSLLINFFHALFPSLLNRDIPFLISMQTPIVRVFLQSSQKLFYNETEFHRYIKNKKNLRFKYYKGLGTSSDKEIRETFGKKVINFKRDEDTDENMSKIFSSNRTDDRKEWLTSYDNTKESSIGNELGISDIDISEYLNSEMIKFSIDDCKRSLPNAIDGLKQSQRKILYTCFLRDLKYTGKSLKVAQLAGSVAEKTNYHHGEQCLYDTITKMAQDFIGTNNIPLLYRDGQFGCVDPNTLVKIWSGGVKLAKNITTMDKLIGDDGKIRNILKITSGYDDMYKVIQESGINYIINSQHILTLVCTITDCVIDMNIKDYMLLSLKTKSYFKGVKVNKHGGIFTTDISIVYLGKGNFCGWETDKNNRFQLEDGTITHNSRIVGGKDAANARYIFTKLDALTRFIFRPEDDVLLTHIKDDGEIVEPEHYIPIIPMILINGSSGIGTGWSCNIPSYNPLDIIKCIKIWLNNMGTDMEKSPLPKLKPWYNNFKGQIIKETDDKFITYGVTKLINSKVNDSKVKDSRVKVSELPVGMWTDKFKEILEDMLLNKTIASFDNYSKPNEPLFEIYGTSINVIKQRLYSYVRTSNMVLFVNNDNLRKFNTIEEIIDNFCTIRWKYYKKRKEYVLTQYNDKLLWNNNKKRFLEDVINENIIIFKREVNDITKDLEDKEYNKYKDSYDYLLKMNIRQFTKDKLNKLDSKIDELKTQIDILEKTTETQLWIKDLDEFEKAYTKSIH